MAGKPKKRIDYAGWSVDMFSNDTKMDKLLEAQGWIGFGIYFYLCQMAFGGEGYFYEWCYDLCATTARKMGGGIGAGTVEAAVDYCFHIGLFDKGLYDRWGVLTSRGIQKSYLVVLKSKNRQGTEIYSEYWLLDKKGKDYQGVIFVPIHNGKLEENDHSLGQNDHSLEENDHSLEQKDSKVKDSKGYKKHIVQSATALFEQLWNLYPCKKGKGQVSEQQKLKLLAIDFDEMSRAIERYVFELEKEGWRKQQNGSTFFNSGYVDYLDANYQSINTTLKNAKKNSFCDFPQRERTKEEYAELEKMISEKQRGQPNES